MTTAEAPQQTVMLAEGTYEIEVDKVVIGKRNRPVREDVSELMSSIDQQGLLQPIMVTTEGLLVFGGNRLKAKKNLGHKTIRAVVVSKDEIDREISEIDENLLHHALTTLERGEHLVRRNELLQARGLRASPQMNKRSPDTPPGVVTTSDIAKAVGITPRTVQREVSYVSKLTDEERDAIRQSPVANSPTELKALVRLAPDERAEVIPYIQTGAARRVAQAQRMAHPEPEQPALAPTVFDNPDAAERRYPVRATVILEFQVTSSKTRVRGEKEGQPRESEHKAYEVALQWPLTIRQKGEDGLRDAMAEVGVTVLQDREIVAAWNRIPAAAALVPEVPENALTDDEFEAEFAAAMAARDGLTTQDVEPDPVEMDPADDGDDIVVPEEVEA